MPWTWIERQVNRKICLQSSFPNHSIIKVCKQRWCCQLTRLNICTPLLKGAKMLLKLNKHVPAHPHLLFPKFPSRLQSTESSLFPRLLWSYSWILNWNNFLIKFSRGCEPFKIITHFNCWKISPFCVCGERVFRRKVAGNPNKTLLENFHVML